MGGATFRHILSYSPGGGSSIESIAYIILKWLHACTLDLHHGTQHPKQYEIWNIQCFLVYRSPIIEAGKVPYRPVKVSYCIAPDLAANQTTVETRTHSFGMRTHAALTLSGMYFASYAVIIWRNSLLGCLMSTNHASAQSSQMTLCHKECWEYYKPFSQRPKCWNSKITTTAKEWRMVECLPVIAHTGLVMSYGSYRRPSKLRNRNFRKLWWSIPSRQGSLLAKLQMWKCELAELQVRKHESWPNKLWNPGLCYK